MPKIRTSPSLTQARLREMVSYEPSTGIFTWVGRGRGIRNGRRAGSKDKGHQIIVIDGVDYYAQRLAWFWMKGEWPDGKLYFRDGDQQNTSFSNIALNRGINGYDTGTREGRAAYSKAWRIANPEKFREISLKKTFGVDLRWYGEKMVEQDGKCAICKTEESGTRLGKKLALAVDHNHTTGDVRGLLCRNCNTLIGHAKENRVVLLSAIKYLDRYNDGEDAKPALLVVNSNKESA